MTSLNLSSYHNYNYLDPLAKKYTTKLTFWLNIMMHKFIVIRLAPQYSEMMNLTYHVTTEFHSKQLYHHRLSVS